MASTCSTWQSPRSRKAFSSASAARPCPAPEEAERIRTRGMRLDRKGGLIRPSQSSGLALSRGEFFQDGACQLLQFSETCQVLLEFVVQQLGILRAKLVPQDHVAELHGMRQ